MEFEDVRGGLPPGGSREATRPDTNFRVRVQPVPLVCSVRVSGASGDASGRSGSLRRAGTCRGCDRISRCQRSNASARAGADAFCLAFAVPRRHCRGSLRSAATAPSFVRSSSSGGLGDPADMELVELAPQVGRAGCEPRRAFRAFRVGEPLVGSLAVNLEEPREAGEARRALGHRGCPPNDAPPSEARTFADEVGHIART